MKQRLARASFGPEWGHRLVWWLSPPGTSEREAQKIGAYLRSERRRRAEARR